MKSAQFTVYVYRVQSFREWVSRVVWRSPVLWSVLESSTGVWRSPVAEYRSVECGVWSVEESSGACSVSSLAPGTYW